MKMNMKIKLMDSYVVDVEQTVKELKAQRVTGYGILPYVRMINDNESHERNVRKLLPDLIKEEKFYTIEYINLSPSLVVEDNFITDIVTHNQIQYELFHTNRNYDQNGMIELFYKRIETKKVPLFKNLNKSIDQIIEKLKK